MGGSKLIEEIRLQVYLILFSIPVSISAILVLWGIKSALSIKIAETIQLATYMALAALPFFELVVAVISLPKILAGQYIQLATIAIHLGGSVTSVIINHAFLEDRNQTYMLMIANICSYSMSCTLWYIVTRKDLARKYSEQEIKPLSTALKQGATFSFVSLCCWYIPTLNVEANLLCISMSQAWPQILSYTSFSLIGILIQIIMVKGLEGVAVVEEAEVTLISFTYVNVCFSLPAKISRLMGGFGNTTNQIVYTLNFFGSTVFGKVLPRLAGIIIFRRWVNQRRQKVGLDKDIGSAENDNHTTQLPETRPDSSSANPMGETKEEYNSIERESLAELTRLKRVGVEKQLPHNAGSVVLGGQNLNLIETRPSAASTLPKYEVQENQPSVTVGLPPLLVNSSGTIHMTDADQGMSKFSMSNEDEISSLQRNHITVRTENSTRQLEKLQFNFELYAKTIEDQAIIDTVRYYSAQTPLFKCSP
ncbi:hypothetical protein HDU76_004576 [Blyttiomyces sp. JEL0837]|nr:hypothetical protein HDU76_004576 [Blyttiomyces sp. JEL0837]